MANGSLVRTQSRSHNTEQHLGQFFLTRQHDDTPTILLPDHLPEVVGCGLHGVLRGDQSFSSPETLEALIRRDKQAEPVPSAFPDLDLR